MKNNHQQQKRTSLEDSEFQLAKPQPRARFNSESKKRARVETQNSESTTTTTTTTIHSNNNNNNILNTPSSAFLSNQNIYSINNNQFQSTSNNQNNNNNNNNNNNILVDNNEDDPRFFDTFPPTSLPQNPFNNFESPQTRKLSSMLPPSSNHSSSNSLFHNSNPSNLTNNTHNNPNNVNQHNAAIHNLNNVHSSLPWLHIQSHSVPPSPMAPISSPLPPPTPSKSHRQTPHRQLDEQFHGKSHLQSRLFQTGSARVNKSGNNSQMNAPLPRNPPLFGASSKSNSEDQLMQTTNLNNNSNSNNTNNTNTTTTTETTTSTVASNQLKRASISPTLVRKNSRPTLSRSGSLSRNSPLQPSTSSSNLFQSMSPDDLKTTNNSNTNITSTITTTPNQQQQPDDHTPTLKRKGSVSQRTPQPKHHASSNRTIPTPNVNTNQPEFSFPQSAVLFDGHGISPPLAPESFSSTSPSLTSLHGSGSWSNLSGSGGGVGERAPEIARGTHFTTEIFAKQGHVTKKPIQSRTSPLAISNGFKIRKLLKSLGFLVGDILDDEMKMIEEQYIKMTYYPQAVHDYDEENINALNQLHERMAEIWLAGYWFVPDFRRDNFRWETDPSKLVLIDFGESELQSMDGEANSLLSEVVNVRQCLIEYFKSIQSKQQQQQQQQQQQPKCDQEMVLDQPQQQHHQITLNTLTDQLNFDAALEAQGKAISRTNSGILTNTNNATTTTTTTTTTTSNSHSTKNTPKHNKYGNQRQTTPQSQNRQNAIRKKRQSKEDAHDATTTTNTSSLNRFQNGVGTTNINVVQQRLFVPEIAEHEQSFSPNNNNNNNGQIPNSLEVVSRLNELLLQQQPQQQPQQQQNHQPNNNNNNNNYKDVLMFSNGIMDYSAFMSDIGLENSAIDQLMELILEIRTILNSVWTDKSYSQRIVLKWISDFNVHIRNLCFSTTTTDGKLVLFVFIISELQKLAREFENKSPDFYF